ncbi:Zinc finger protein 347 [Fusarium oxysporum f. sp. cubense]|uniref:Zinc finger protein 347 n=1 Tax=Fusarium oxysporum f. sp. cubense TaxID=61366 RepID=A0A559L644_FUSOC|nr:Zinc finger protein 347 [Fusarium oxysporum f. sp. cubense]
MNQPKACSTCGSVFSSKSHLARHERSHMPDQYTPCFFCGRLFSRADSARRHAKQCDQRAGRPIPTDVKRGRGPKACDRCALSKLACDTDEPCETCLSRGWRCSYDRVEGVLDARSNPTNPISSAPQVESWDPWEDSASTQDSDDATRSNVTKNEKTLFLLRYKSPDNKNILDFRNALETSSALPDEAGSPPCDLQEDGGQLLSQEDIDMWNLLLIWKILLNRGLEKACTG